ncbi:MAG: hypothetical protein U1C19_03130 [Methanobacteriaceae archaeon]|jgi:hypothetical protein|nr:hypothetical protein [Methanobacteriaceae archaeon]
MTDLCTINEIKTKSRKRITDNTLDTVIQNEITSLTNKLQDEFTDLTITDRDANLCCIYGVLARLVIDKIIPEDDTRSVRSYSDGRINISFDDNSLDTGPRNDCEWYKHYYNKLGPDPDDEDGVSSNDPFFIGVLRGY